MARPVATYIIDGKQLCRRCKISKPISSFWKTSGNLTGISRYCKDCTNIKRQESRGRVKTGTLKHRKGFWPEKGTQEYELFRRNKNLIKTYGIDMVQYQELLTLQRESCAICRIHQSELKRPLDVDHNHDTGQIRGLLCSNCNTASGLLKDNKYLLTRAGNYLDNKILIKVAGIN